VVLTSNVNFLGPQSEAYVGICVCVCVGVCVCVRERETGGLWCFFHFVHLTVSLSCQDPIIQESHGGGGGVTTHCPSAGSRANTCRVTSTERNTLPDLCVVTFLFPSPASTRLSDRGSGPAVPDHPRPRPDLHPAAASPGVDHHALLHRPGHHRPHRHLRPAGDVPLAPRGRPLRPLDRLRRKLVFFIFIY